MKTKDLIKNIKGVFKLPIKKYYLGSIKYYTPYFEPMGFHSSIISFRKLKRLSEERLEENRKRGYGWAKEKYSNMPMVRRSKNFIVKIFGNEYYVQVGKPFAVVKNELGWKDKYGCYDKETEVLTEKGWKYFKDVDYTDKLACLNNKNTVEYHTPSNLTNEHYSGKMYRLSSQSVDLLVTPNHNLYVAKGNLAGRYENNVKKFDFELCTPDKYYKKSKRFLKSFKWEGEEIEEIIIPGYSYTKGGNKKGVINNYIIEDQHFNADWFLKFLGFFVAEGCANEVKGEVFIACCNDGSVKAITEQKEFEEILNNLNLDIRKTHTERTAIGYKIYNKALAKWMVLNCGKLAHNKKTPQFIKSLSSRQINLYLEWLYKGDGHKTKTAHVLCTTSKTLSNDVEELIVKGGKSFYTFIIKKEQLNKKESFINGRLIVSKHDSYHINWLQNKSDVNIENKTIRKAKKYVEEWVDYDDKVYCATVPHNKLFIKRSGKGVWCGNSPRYEWLPSFQIWFFKWQFCIHWTAPEVEGESSEYPDLYFEMILWYLKYYKEYGSDKPDIDKARSSWGWVDGETKESTWNKNYEI